MALEIPTAPGPYIANPIPIEKFIFKQQLAALIVLIAKYGRINSSWLSIDLDNC